MKSSALLAAFVAFAFLPLRADAQQMKLQIENGRVTLDAQNVPVRQILAEWARVGGAKIVNGDKVVGAPMTLQLQGMPERQALDIILRGVSGYMLAARQDTTPGVSAFDRILILATSSAPRNAGPAPAPTGFGSPAANRRMPVMAEPVPTEDVVVEDEDADNDEPEAEEEPVSEGEGEGGAAAPHMPTAPTQTPGMPRGFQPRRDVFPNPMGAQMQPFNPGNIQPFTGQQPPPQQQPDPNTVTPFGVPTGGSTVPGVVTPVPQPQPGQPTPRRPPQ